MQNKSPIQQAIENFKSHIGNLGSESDLALEVCVHYLESILPKEKEFVGKVWDAAISHHEQEERSPGLAGPRNPLPDKNKFINQLYPKQ